MENIREWLAAFTTLMIGALGLWIAYQQLRIERQQHRLEGNRLRLDLFDRRYSIFDAARNLVEEAVKNSRTPEEAFWQFRAKSVGASFLLSKDTVEHIDSLRERYSRMLAIEEMKKDNDFGGDEQRPARMEELRNLRQKMREEFQQLEDVFRHDLDLSGV